MDEIETRLKEASEKCAESYCAWSEKKSDAELRGTLQEAVHELRKVSARLEIEIATSERDQMAKKPIPVPSHRASRHKGGNNHAESKGDKADAAGGDAPTENAGPKTEIKRRRTVRKPRAAGSSES